MIEYCYFYFYIKIHINNRELNPLLDILRLFTDDIELSSSALRVYRLKYQLKKDKWGLKIHNFEQPIRMISLPRLDKYYKLGNKVKVFAKHAIDLYLSSTSLFCASILDISRKLQKERFFNVKHTKVDKLHIILSILILEKELFVKDDRILCELLQFIDDYAAINSYATLITQQKLSKLGYISTSMMLDGFEIMLYQDKEIDDMRDLNERISLSIKRIIEKKFR